MAHVNMGAPRGHAIAHTTGIRALVGGVVGPRAELAKRSRVLESLYKEYRQGEVRPMGAAGHLAGRQKQ
jgi:hypothetical protein